MTQAQLDDAATKVEVAEASINQATANLAVGRLPARPEEIKAAAYEKLAKSIDTAEFATQFYFGDGGRLNVWCEGENHATGDYWLFDVPVTGLEGLATEQLLPIIETLKSLGN